MSLSICSSEWMFSSPRGTGLDASWFPRPVAERFTTSTRDGAVERSPDPVPFIESEISWTNSTDAQQRVWVEIHRAPRVIIASNPNTYVLDDALSWDTGTAPNAPTPYASDDGIGARVSLTPFNLNQIVYGRLFRGWDDSVRYEPIGTLTPGQTVHARYAALYTSPGQWRTPNTALQVVRAYWVRMRLWAAPEATP
jgi:hypothetical protein